MLFLSVHASPPQHSGSKLSLHSQTLLDLFNVKCKLLHFPILRPGINKPWRPTSGCFICCCGTNFPEPVFQTPPCVKWPFSASFLFSPAVDCLDPTCSNHGVCVNGECLCSPGWGGVNCELPRAQCPDQCSGHGSYLADTGLCSCDPNWMGPDCSVGKKKIFPWFCTNVAMLLKC